MTPQGAGVDRSSSTGPRAPVVDAVRPEQLDLEEVVFRRDPSQVKPGDPATFAATAALLTAIALGACWLAARRALAVDLNEALRRD